MAKKKAAEADNTKSTSKKRGKKVIAGPEISILARYSPTASSDAHPYWVKKRFPSYIDAHGGHEATSVREFSHAGHVIKIITTYRVEVDGQPIQGHLSVDEDGRVYTHATPFVTYGSAIDLMKAVVDAYPESFADIPGDTPVAHHHAGKSS